MSQLIVTCLAILEELLKYIHRLILTLAREGGLEPTTLGFGDRCSTN